MSTRCNVELYRRYEGREIKDALLYHHHDGYASWMGPELVRRLDAAMLRLAEANVPYWWDGERVGALMVSQSLTGADFHYGAGVPRFQPCLKLHSDINYLWRVYLGPKDGEYEIECFEIDISWQTGEIRKQKAVDWKKEAGING